MITDQDVLDALTKVLRSMFHNEGIQLDLGMVASELIEWDSATNIAMAVEVEHEFRVKFKTTEMEQLCNLGDLVSLVKSQLETAPT